MANGVDNLHCKEQVYSKFHDIKVQKPKYKLRWFNNIAELVVINITLNCVKYDLKFQI